VTAMQTNVAKAYQQQAVLTASKEKLVVLLYDGAILNIDRAQRAFDASDVAAVGEAIGKAFAIIGELRSSIDHEQGGEIAENLERLYDFAQDRLFNANRNRDPSPLSEARSVLVTLKEGWNAVIRS
jgi:flagellar protein FliS